MSWRNNYQDESINPTFNQAQLFVTRLDELSGMIDRCIVEGNLLAAFRLTKRVYRRIRYKVLQKPENKIREKTYADYAKEIEKDFQRINSLLKSNNKLNMNVVTDELDSVDDMIWELMWDLELIMKKESEYDWRDEVKASFT